jgi:DNA gyrase subunit A
LEVTDEDGLMIINKSGMTIRMATDKLRVMGRAAQGVRLINIKEKDAIANIAKTPREDDEEELEGELVDGIIVEDVNAVDTHEAVSDVIEPEDSNDENESEDLIEE